MDRTYIMVVVSKGYKGYHTVDIDNVVDQGDCYGIMGKGVELFLDKECCVVEYGTMIITYKTKDLKVIITPGC